jgi:hypothetical protein
VTVTVAASEIEQSRVPRIELFAFRYRDRLTPRGGH